MATATATPTTEPKITVILPVYNVADFLPRCLRSIDKQTFRDFRVIAVNDGSTDDSPRILREFEASHPYFTVIDQNNQGLAAARNTGLALAKTEYISFIDSDDFVAPTFLEELYLACEANDADIACCYYYYAYVESRRRIQHPFRCSGVFTREEALKKLLQDIQLQSYAWNKLYRRKLFSEHQITYPSMAFEDMATTHKLFQYANRVAIIDRPLYYYVQRKTSILKTPNWNKINDFVRAAASVRVSLERSGEFPQFKRNFRQLCWKTNFYCDYYLLKCHLSRKNLKGFSKNMKSIWKSFQYYNSDQFDSKAIADLQLETLPDALPAHQIAMKK